MVCPEQRLHKSYYHSDQILLHSPKTFYSVIFDRQSVGGVIGTYANSHLKITGEVLHGSRRTHPNSSWSHHIARLQLHHGTGRGASPAGLSNQIQRMSRARPTICRTNMMELTSSTHFRRTLVDITVINNNVNSHPLVFRVYSGTPPPRSCSTFTVRDRMVATASGNMLN